VIVFPQEFPTATPSRLPIDRKSLPEASKLDPGLLCFPSGTPALSTARLGRVIAGEAPEAGVHAVYPPAVAGLGHHGVHPGHLRDTFMGWYWGCGMGEWVAVGKGGKGRGSQQLH